MTTLLVRNATLLVTMDDHRREIPGGGLFARNGFIEQVGSTDELPVTADEVVDMAGCVVLPGLINTHHHFFQTLTRAVPAAQNANLFRWLETLYPIWAGLMPEDIYISTRTALAELALSGCTTASDHLYIYPNGCRLDDEIAGAKSIGVRLHASRGSMSVGESQGGLPPDHVVEDEAFILRDSQRLIERYHDSGPGSMVQVVIAPCSPFSVSRNLMKESAKLARAYGVHLHTHLAETEDEEDYCLQKFDARPVGYMEQLDWLGEDVWFAHSIYVNQTEIRKYASTGCGVAHCPSSNMRLASGIAPIQQLLHVGVKVGLGVDGSASNDSSHLLAEARQAMLLARLKNGLEGASRSGGTVEFFTPRQALELATRGGAAVLGRKDIGSLEVGKCADFIAFDMDTIGYAGALSDPVGALFLCSAQNVDASFVHGKAIVRDGKLVVADLDEIIREHNAASSRLLAKV